ncbi:CsgE family curli-type amyloid fiber assembly protein [Flavobacterium sp. LB2R40]|uniref:CsgE family curli-type amyloid fiber assembly protein n=1 Tax=unclassified Flavobacterium TaxID=196869 RepID=UPI003AAD4CF9
MKSSIFRIVSISFLLFITVGFSQNINKDIKPKIEVEEVENTLSITGTVENLKSEFRNISFKLTVFKKNKLNSNRSDNAQDGRVTLEPIQKVFLSKTQVNRSKEDEIIILLLIYDEDNTIIGKDRRVFGGADETEVTILKPKDGLEMLGIISNETKTKLGNDFYDFFYSEFSKLKIKSQKIITVQEELTFGRTTKIILKVDSDVIEEFIARPDEDFLKYMAESSATKIFQYFKNIEKQAKFITQY